MNHSSTELDINPPQQGRTLAGWERILDAGLSILVEQGYEAFTIAAICERAKVNPPAIYARVRTKKALFLAVFEHGFRALRDETEARRARLTGGTPDTVIRNAVEAIARTTLAHERFNRPVVLRAEADPEIALRTRQARSETSNWFRGLMLQQKSALRSSNPDDIDRCFHVIFAALIARVATPSALDIGTPYSDDAFIADLQETAVRWLL
ncbi:TetR/AcrR family transcriptional regulator [Novosphingobium sp. BL-8H]|uniref:TetR/AcrR family transcriptional regulator n=1 Tax=Novosphingobium sp. BL-8H TaxID=3127640 RepID=UPI003756F187